MENARKEGEEIGEKIGEKNAKKNTAKIMLANGYKIDEIIKITGLTKEEVEKLSKIM